MVHSVVIVVYVLVKRVTRSMTGILSRKQYLAVRENKHRSRPSCAGTDFHSVFKLGE